MKHNPKSAAYNSLTQVIDQMVANRVDRGTIDSLRNMLNFDAFQPIRKVIEDKIIEIGNYLKSKEVPPVPPIEVYMGTIPKKTESNEEETWAPFEYENTKDVRESYNTIKSCCPDIEFDFPIENIN